MNSGINKGCSTVKISRQHDAGSEKQEDHTVSDIVSHHPQMRQRLEKLGIDYCCGGKKQLLAAAQDAGLEWPAVLTALQAEPHRSSTKSADVTDWNSVSLSMLVDYIEKKHHLFIKEQLPRLDDLLARVRKAHGVKHGAFLGKLRGIYDSFRKEIEPHLMKEEQVIFPAIRMIDAYVSGPRPDIDDDTIVRQIRRLQLEHVSTRTIVTEQIRKLELEHVSTGALLAGMRIVTESYHIPYDACQKFMALYDGLKALQADLHEHIHLENNILFPKSVTLLFPEK